MKKDKEWLKKEVEDYLAIEGVYDARTALKAALEYIDQLDEPELPVIPQFVADYIDKSKTATYSLLGSMSHFSHLEDMHVWIRENQETFARAWIDGYAIEKEKLYYVRENNYLLCRYNDEVIDYVEAVEREITDLVNLKLTEKEIKDYDERYWAFAEEVTK